jgi:hypothetical protein
VKFIYIGETLDRVKNQKLGIGGNGEKKKAARRRLLQSI